MKLIGGCGTDRGGYRDNNQDAILFRMLEREGVTFALGIVCDGIGGLENGEIASQFIVSAADHWFNAAAQWVEPAKVDTDIMMAHLRDGAEDWNYRLCEYIRDKGLRMGTTMSGIMLLGDRAFIIHVGDSRIYRYNLIEGLVPLTTDMVVTKMSGGRMKSFLDNYMGKSTDLWYQSFETMIQPGDLILYCTDGFYHEFSEMDADQMHEHIRSGENVNSICQTAIETIIARGERDNISVGLIYIGEADAKEEKIRTGGIFTLFGKKRTESSDDTSDRTKL